MLKDMEAEVLLHEILHGILYTFNVVPKLETIDAVIDREKGDLEEYIVTQISTALATVIRQNPKLITYLVERLK